MHHGKLLLLVAFSCLAATAAEADPIRVTSGRVFFSLNRQQPGSADYHLVAEDIEFGEADAEDQLTVVPAVPQPLEVGAVVDLSAFKIIEQNELNSPARGTLGDGRLIEVTGPMSFHAPNAPVTECSFNPHTFTTNCFAHGFFTFSANLTVADRSTHQFLFRREFIGSGTALGRLSPDRFLSDYVFTFDASQTPEPGTLLLLGSSLAALGIRRRTRVIPDGCG